MKKKSICLVIMILMFVLVFSFSVTCIRSDNKAKNSFNNEVKIEKTYFDIPSLIGKDGWEIKEILEKSHGKPDIYNEPIQELIGTINWTLKIENTRNFLMFGYDFYKNGEIADNTLVLTGIIGEGKPVFFIEDVLRAGNLKENASNYTIEINMDDETYKNVWIIMNK